MRGFHKATMRINKLKTIKRCALCIYPLFSTIRYFIWLILQCYYLILLQIFERQGLNAREKQEIKDQLLKVYSWMLTSGSIQRNSGTAAVFYYSIAFSVLICYSTKDPIPIAKLFDYLKDNRFISYLQNDYSESKRISERIDILLRDLSISNDTFTNIVADSRNYENLTDEDLDQRFLDKMSAEIGQHSSHTKSFSQCDSRRYEFYEKEAEVSLHHALYRQLNHLNKLTKNRSKIWPSNRNLTWTTKMKKIWLTCYIEVFLLTWLIGQTTCFLGTKAALSTTNSNEFIGEKNDKILLLDRFNCCESHIFSYSVVCFFIEPITILVVSTLDQFEHLKSMKLKMRKATENLHHFRKWQDHINPLIRSDYKLTLQAEREFMFECDKDAIELYISYHIFRDEIKSSMLVAQRATNQNATFILITTLPILIFIKDVRENDYVPLIMISLNFIVSINGTFLLCAILHTLCVRLSKQVWSYIAMLEEYNFDTVNKSQVQRNKDDEWGTFSGLLIATDETTSNLSYLKKNIYLLYNSKSFVTPHTMLLWRRLVERQEFIEENFACKLFGFLKVDFSGILKLNYWLISFALLTLTYRRSMY